MKYELSSEMNKKFCEANSRPLAYLVTLLYSPHDHVHPRKVTWGYIMCLQFYFFYLPFYYFQLISFIQKIPHTNLPPIYHHIDRSYYSKESLYSIQLCIHLFCNSAVQKRKVEWKQHILKYSSNHYHASWVVRAKANLDSEITIKSLYW